VNASNIALALFALFSLALPIWGMQSNDFDGRDNHGCSGECYQAWKAETGGVLALAAAAAEAKASASPAELGQLAYNGCIACHGAGGEGGVGPQLSGQDATTIADKLLRYKNGETIGGQSALMWSQAATLSDEDITNISAFIETL